jgi:hypothetical protein
MRHSQGRSSAIILDRDQWIHRPGVVSVTIGRKEIKDKLTHRLCVKIYVREKKKKSTKGLFKFPKTARILVPSGKGIYKMRRISTDVVELRNVHVIRRPPNVQPNSKAAASDNSISTVRSGAKIGMDPLTYSEYGTMGCVVQSRIGGEKYLLSAGHILPRAAGQISSYDIYQPPCLNPGRKVGKTKCSLVDNDAAAGGYIDAVLIKIDHSVLSFTNASMDGRVPKPKGFLSLEMINERHIPIHKVGATTGYTRGEYSSFHDSLSNDSTGEVFHNILEFKKSDDSPSGKIADKGDSGSIAISRDGENEGRIVGLLFAKSDDGQRAYVIPFERIARYFNIDVADD